MKEQIKQLSNVTPVDQPVIIAATKLKLVGNMMTRKVVKNVEKPTTTIEMMKAAVKAIKKKPDLDIEDEVAVNDMPIRAYKKVDTIKDFESLFIEY